MAFDFGKIEERWQKVWEEEGWYPADVPFGKQQAAGKKPRSTAVHRQSPTADKCYVLVEFPYPSGSGLHVGHAFTMTGADVYARKKRMEGKNVLFPMGWDAFGLPTENYAIKTGIHPAVVTKGNTDNFRRQMKKMAFSFDWRREINTTDPDYYRFTQWIFIQLFKHGLAYKAKMPINWCPSCKIGLANEEVINGKCERCGAPVERRELAQWLLRITAYADRLIDDLRLVDFPESVKAAQINWIGKSKGAIVLFPLADFLTSPTTSEKDNSASTLEPMADSQKPRVTSQNTGGLGLDRPAPALGPRRTPQSRVELGWWGGRAIPVFTTRPDTIFGATFLVLAPEHWLVEEILNSCSQIRGRVKLTNGQIKKIKKYVKTAKAKSELERAELQKEKTGVFSGLWAINPATGKKIPIWISDFVLAHYGTGAIMGVPAHDARDFEFAKKYNLPIVEVIKPFGRKQRKLLDSNIFADFTAKQLKQVAKRFYQAVLGGEEIYSPVLKRKVVFNWKGWEHLRTKARTKMEFVSRLAALPKVPFVVAGKAKLLGKTKIKKDGKTIRYWALGGKVDGVAVKVIIRQVGKGKRHFWSVVWQGEKKKAAVSRLFPRIQSTKLVDSGGWMTKYNTFVSLLSRGVEPREEKKEGEMKKAWEGDGLLINSGPFNLMPSAAAKIAIVAWLGKKGLARPAVSYHLRDWIFSRQHYWGEPIPMVYCPSCAKKGITWWDTKEGKEFLRIYEDTNIEYKGKNKKYQIPMTNNQINTNDQAPNKFRNNIGEKAGGDKGRIALKLPNSQFVVEFDKKELAGWFPLPEEELPLKLPEVDRYQPTGTGKSPLAAVKDWVKTRCPVCGGKARRETDTMPNWAGSSWYFLAYTFWKEHKASPTTSEKDNSASTLEPMADSQKPRATSQNTGGLGLDRLASAAKLVNAPSPTQLHSSSSCQTAGECGLGSASGAESSRPAKKPFAPYQAQLRYWLPVDVYFGGAEHTTLHLLYSRFWHKFLYDLGVVPTPEPYQKRVVHGVVLGPDGQKMSKSRGNVINPDDVWQKVGVDALRTYLMFMGPYGGTTAWSDNTLSGVVRFLQRFWRFVNRQGKAGGEQGKQGRQSKQSVQPAKVAFNHLIQKVSRDIDNFQFNTAVAAMMEFLNQAEANNWRLENGDLKTLVKLLAPFAPYMAEELWHRLGEKGSVHHSLWPQPDPRWLKEEEKEIVVQINGKLRATIKLPAAVAENQKEVERRAQKEEKVAKHLVQGKLIKVVFVPGRLINFVTKN